jgi:hypothetical protein
LREATKESDIPLIIFLISIILTVGIVYCVGIYLFVRRMKEHRPSTKSTENIEIGEELTTNEAAAVFGMPSRGYLPPTVSSAGAGIKRGLTAPEAAVVLRVPIRQILTMILFGLIKKGILRITYEGDNSKILLIDTVQNRLLHDYEIDFVNSVGKNGNLLNSKIQKTISNMIGIVTLKLRGFSIDETRRYYQSIVDKAWDQIGQTQDPQKLGRLWANNVQWVLTDERYDKKIEEVIGDREIIVPNWFRLGFDVYRLVGSGLPGYTARAVLSGAELANGLVTGVEVISGGLIKGVESAASTILGVGNLILKSIVPSIRLLFKVLGGIIKLGK